MDQDYLSKGRVIITAGRSLMALVAARSLGSRDIEVIGADCLAPNLLSMSRFSAANETYANPSEEPESFLDDLEEIVRKHKPTDHRPYVLMPIFRETSLIIEHQHRFAPYITVATTSYQSLEQVHPKDRLARTAQRLQINIPRTLLPHSSQELFNAKEHLAFPFLIKPYDASGGRGIKKVASDWELKQAFSENCQQFGRPPLLQEMVEGEDYCYAVLFQKGKRIVSSAYRNLYNFPRESGSGVMRESVDATVFDTVADSLLGPIGWHGVAQLDFRWDGEANHLPKLIEVNPRFWAGLFQSVEAGVDFPWLNYQMFCGDQLYPIQSSSTAGVKTKEPMSWYLSALEESFSEVTQFEVLSNQGRQAVEHAKGMRLGEAFSTLAGGIKNGIKIQDAYQHYLKVLKDADEAKTQMMDKDDPCYIGSSTESFHLK